MRDAFLSRVDANFSCLNHTEISVVDLDSARISWGWLFAEPGWSVDQKWDYGTSWRCGDVCLVTSRPPALSGGAHDRRLPEISHLALHGGSQADLDRILSAAVDPGRNPLYADRYPTLEAPTATPRVLKIKPAPRSKLWAKPERQRIPTQHSACRHSLLNRCKSVCPVFLWMFELGINK